MSVDLLLANPLFLAQDEAERELMSPYFPLGLLYLASFVRERGFSVEIFDGTFAKDESAFAGALERHRPRVVGVTALLPSREPALSLARAAHAFGAPAPKGDQCGPRHAARPRRVQGRGVGRRAGPGQGRTGRYF